MSSDQTATTRRTLRLIVAGSFAALALMTPFEAAEAAGAVHIAESPDETEPAVDPPEEPTVPEDVTTPDDAEEPALEPSEVSPAVWVGAILLLIVAVVWAVRQTTKSSPSSDPASDG